jgi:hypothetical protein
VRRGLIIMALAVWPLGCAAANSGIVENPEKCEAQWEIRLASYREQYGHSDGWNEQFILDANIGGDFKMAQRYMEKYGWFAAANENPNDLTLHFMPDTNPPNTSGDTRFDFKKLPVGIPSEGLKRACYAAWISGVPFTRVTRRGVEGKDVLYSITTENLPVNDF